jgi:hypothetical protein
LNSSLEPYCYASPLDALLLYREYFYFVDRFHGSAHHDDRCTAGCEARTNFTDESACLTADNVRNEIVTIHRSQEILKMLCHYT